MPQRTLLVVGCNGQLGRDLMIRAGAAGYAVKGVDLPNIDITDEKSVRAVVADAGAATVVNCAAYTAVDKCETDRDAAFAVNALGAGLCAHAARRLGARFVHISTDYVFDGAKTGAYVESDTPNPKSVYGKSKLAGEERVAAEGGEYGILRIAWLYGVRGANFVKTIRRLAQERAGRGEPLKVVDDQIGSPTYTMEVCRQILRLIESGQTGLFHCTAEGSCSWFDFALAIVTAYGIDTPVVPCTTAEFPRPAPRPANSVLENARLKALGLNVMKPWREAFDDYLAEERSMAPERT